MTETKKDPIHLATAAGPMPGSTRVDAALLDVAVDEINRATTSSGLEHTRAVGEIVVLRFGGGDLDAFRSGAAGHASWRALADRDDLTVSHSFLWSAVAVLDQLRRLPADIGNALSVSHHRRLLAVKDDDLRLQLATQAVAERMTVDDLEDAIAATARTRTRPGRRAGSRCLSSRRRSGRCPGCSKT